MSDRSRGHRVRELFLAILSVVAAVAPGPAAGQGTVTVTGTVVDAGSERPIAGADVVLRATGTPDVVRATTTRRDGTFRLTDVTRGRYVLQVQRLGYRSYQRTLVLELREARDLAVTLTPEGAGAETVVVSPTQRTERALTVPASVSLVPPETIRREGVTSSVEALGTTMGVDVAQTGVDRRMLSLRGFGTPFAGTPHVRVDGREAAPPLLGTNVFAAAPTLPLDLRRIEVVRGPGATLYGPEASEGVVQFVTRGPFQEPGTALSVAGGTRSFVDAQVRQAGVLGGTVGYKLTGQYGRATEWTLDPDDPRDRTETARYRTYGPDEPIPPGRPTAGRQLRRGDLYRTYTANGLLTYRFDDGTALSLRGGYASVTSPLQTGLGTIQADPLTVGYGQLRLTSGPFEAQMGVHRNLERGDTYLLRTGERVVGAGTKWTGRTQYDVRLGALDTQLLVGSDIDVVRPEGSTSTLARQRGDGGIGRYGAFVQSTSALTPDLSFTVGGRVSYNDVTEDASVQSEAALTYELASSQALWTSFARSVSRPGTDPLFAAGRFAVDPTVRTTAHTVEAGYRGAFPRLRVDVSGYYETKRNVLTPSRSGDGLAYDVAGPIRYAGLDAGVEAAPTPATTAFVTASVVTDDRFGGGDAAVPVALNAPSFKATGGLDLALPADFSVGATGRYVNGFPVRWGPYVGSVGSSALLDLRVGHNVSSVPGLRVDAFVKNVLGTEHREFVGAPALGRTVTVRVTYDLS